MSRIDDLIDELCSGGVPHERLGDIAAYSTAKIDASELDAKTFVGVDNLVANKGGRVDATYPPNSARLAAFAPGDILLGNIRPYLKKIWLSDRTGGCSGDVLAVRRGEGSRDQVRSQFLYYVLSSDRFFAYNMKHAKGAKMPRGSKPDILEYPVPVPPLEVQNEVVRVLDTFSALTAELEAELEARRAQYQHYRDSLLVAREATEWSTLGEVSANVSSGSTPLSTRSDFYRGTIPWVRTKDVAYADIYDTESKITERAVQETGAKWIPRNCILVALSGAGVTRGRVAVNKVPVTTNQHCCNLELDEEKVHYRFVYHWLVRQYLDLRSRGRGNRSDLNISIVRNYPVPVPPLEEQARIADVLDKFDALVNDLAIGLPAEIEARRKQYEYYRDRLLTFEEAPA